MESPQTVLTDRFDAGRQIAALLRTQPPAPDTVVLALPRGGVPVGSTFAEAFGLPLEPLAVRKLGVPHFPELAMGALASGGQCLLDSALQQQLHLSEKTVADVIRREQAELARREQRFPMSLPLSACKGRPVILVDDGMATGYTMLAAIGAVRAAGASSVTVAVPVAARDAVERVSALVDQMLTLVRPEPFGSVGQWYRDFRQVDEREVDALLGRAQRLRAPGISAGSMASH